MVLVKVFLVFSSVCVVFGISFLDLGGTWRVSDEQNEYDLPARVPGGIYSDLLNYGIISDFFAGYGDVTTRWVALKNWTFRVNFSVPEEILDQPNINLIFEGLDTFSTIKLNNHTVGTSTNMFVKYIFDTKPYLELTDNDLSITFQSPVEVATNNFKRQSELYTVPPNCVPNEYNGECHVNHIRKMQASFAWDWGPAFPSVGIWKRVYVEAFTDAVVRDVTVSYELNAVTDSWDVVLCAYLSGNSVGVIEGKLLVKLSTDVALIERVFDVELFQNKSSDDVVTVQQFSVPQLYVKLWWPNGYGKQNLYKLRITFVSKNSKEASVKHIKLGFRTLALKQNPLSTYGKTFHFEVNNVPIFMKGSNLIPINILPELGQNITVVKFLLRSARDVHMNMLRVWGGGVYESDALYELADELGIMIWQDFMFACSMYPTNEEFVSTVRDEVRHQVRRLQHHPSVILWAANNENEAALRQNWYGTAANFTLYKNDFVKLYVDTVRDTVLRNDETRPILTSSPTNGVESETEGFVAKDPQSKFFGDVHYYNYIQDGLNVNIYPISRFASEYGYQSLPCVRAWLSVTNTTDDLNVKSEFMLHRQHHFGGYDEMKLLIGKQFELPPESDVSYFSTFVFYSQIIQAMSVKVESEYYRTWRSNLNGVGEGLTMGALYWQLNDVWVAPTWSSIDFKLNWKMVHYFAREFFAPVIVSGWIDNNRSLHIFVVSDKVVPIYKSTVKISVFRWNNFEPLNVEEIPMHVLPGMSQLVTSFWIDKYLSNVKCGSVITARYSCLIHLTLVNDKNESIAPENYVFPSQLNQVALPAADLRVARIKDVCGNGTVFEVDVTSDMISLFTWLDCGALRGVFSENGFLQVTAKRSMYFYPTGATTEEQIARNIKIMSLNSRDK